MCSFCNDTGVVTISGGACSVRATCPVCAEEAGQDMQKWAKALRMQAYKARQRALVTEWDRRVKKLCG